MEATCFSLILVLVLRMVLKFSHRQHVCDRPIPENSFSIYCFMHLSGSIITPQISNKKYIYIRWGIAKHVKHMAKS